MVQNTVRRAVVRLQRAERDQQEVGGCTDSRLGDKHTVQDSGCGFNLRE